MTDGVSQEGEILPCLSLRPAQLFHLSLIQGLEGGGEPPLVSTFLLQPECMELYLHVTCIFGNTAVCIPFKVLPFK
jgi:hypothetical protein